MRGDAVKIAALFRRRAARLEREFSEAARRLAPLLLAENKRVLQTKIYNVPIPQRASAPRSLAGRTTAGKHGLWQRTGLLKRSESTRTERTTVILANGAGYAVWRYVLGLPGHRTPRYTLSVQWHKEAIANKADRINRERREALWRALRG